MKVNIAVDANIIISALLGGAAEEILFKSTFRFLTTDFTMIEVKKYIPYVSKKVDISEDRLLTALSLLPIEVYNKNNYENFIPMAEKMISDKNDAPILALALYFHSPLWTNDKHFDNVKEILIVKTKDLL